MNHLHRYDRNNIRNDGLSQNLQPNSATSESDDEEEWLNRRHRYDRNNIENEGQSCNFLPNPITFGDMWNLSRSTRSDLFSKKKIWFDVLWNYDDRDEKNVGSCDKILHRSNSSMNTVASLQDISRGSSSNSTNNIVREDTSNSTSFDVSVITSGNISGTISSNGSNTIGRTNSGVSGSNSDDTIDIFSASGTTIATAPGSRDSVRIVNSFPLPLSRY